MRGYSLCMLNCLPAAADNLEQETWNDLEHWRGREVREFEVGTETAIHIRATCPDVYNTQIGTPAGWSSQTHPTACSGAAGESTGASGRRVDVSFTLGGAVWVRFQASLGCTQRPRRQAGP